MGAPENHPRCSRDHPRCRNHNSTTPRMLQRTTQGASFRTKCELYAPGVLFAPGICLGFFSILKALFRPPKVPITEPRTIQRPPRVNLFIPEMLFPNRRCSLDHPRCQFYAKDMACLFTKPKVQNRSPRVHLSYLGRCLGLPPQAERIH